MSDDASQQTSLDEIVGEYNREKEDEAVDAGKLQEIDESPVEGWELCRLGEMFSLEYGENLTEDARDGGQYPVYGSNGQVGSHSEAYVDCPGIIVGRKGSIGEAEFSEGPFHPIDTTYYISEYETDENLRFVYYLLENIQLSRLNAASAIPGLNRNDAYSLKGLLPTLQEQRKIASVIYNVDKAIQKTEEIIQQTERLHTGLRRELVIAGIDHTEFQEMRVGPFTFEIPASWEIVSIDKACKNLDRDRIPVKQAKREEMQGDIPYYGASGVIDYVDDYLFDDDLILLAEDGENLLSRNLPISFKISGKAWVNNHAHVLKPREEFDIDYLVEYFERLNYEPFVTGSAQPKLTQTNMDMLSVPKPPEEEQAEISSKLTSVSDHKNRSEQYKEKLQRLKQGLMQDLLSGKVRTHNKDIEVLPEVEKHD